jgi:nitronate monooxygenase
VTDLVKRLGLTKPLIVAPMAGGPSTPELVAAVSAAGALGSIGAAYSNSEAILEFATKVRSLTDKPFAINLFAPHPVPAVNESKITRAIAVTDKFRQELELSAPQVKPPFEEDFDSQFEAVLRAKPSVFSFIFGRLDLKYVKAAQAAKIFVIGTATTFNEARELEGSGVHAIILQGIEAGGHRGTFETSGDDPAFGMMALLQGCRNKMKVPLIAAGGIMTAAQVREALANGAQAVQMGTAFLACREAGTSDAYKAKLLESLKRPTKMTRVFSGRLARAIENRFMREMDSSTILPYPVQNAFTRDLRAASLEKNSTDFLSLWCGTGEGALWQGSAVELIDTLFAQP